ncbi:glycosyl hydrolase family 18 protein [Neobacillus sp. NRS-1170]|uniref:glycosyl hydrolase family 18 protein n=1 Tax=Neobacillus sp. NRS-1170 TaxID=3233898 RepID=UPI003D2D045B
MAKKLWKKLSFGFLSVSLLSTSVLSIAEAADNPPWVSPIQLSPLSSDGVTVSGDVQISVTAGDDLGVSKVEFYSANGGYLIGTKTSAPYTLKWATDPWVPDGEQVVKVIAYDKSGQKAGASRKVYVQNDKTAPAAPTNLQTTAKTNKSISLTWNAASDNVGVTVYEIYNGQVLIGTSTGSSVTLNDLTPGTTYNLSVKAKDRAGNVSAASNILNETTQDLPPTVSSLEVSPLDYDGETVTGNVKLSINVTDDTGISKVEFYSADGGYLIGTKTSEPYAINWATDPWVPEGEQIVKAIAYDKAGQKTESSRQVYVQNDKVAPSTPANIRLTGKTDQTISLAWDSSSDNIGVTEYEIYNGLVRIGTSTSNSVTLKDLNPGKSFNLTVKARDRAWNFSAASNTVQVTTDASKDTIPPSIPANLKVTDITDTTMKLEWDAAKDNYDNISPNTTYQIYNGSTLLATSSGLRTTVRSLNANTAYTLTVKAKDAAGNISAASQSVTASTGTLDTAAPQAPVNLHSPASTDKTITLKWSEPADNYGVTSYTIYQNKVKIMDTASPNFVIGGLLPNTKYSFYVTAKDAKGNVSPASPEITASTGSQPLTPPSHVIAGYYAGWSTYSGSEVSDIDASKLTQINYAFANIGNDLKMQVGDPYADTQKEFPGDSATDPFKGNFNQLKKLKQKFPHLKTVISVGGWSWSDKFSEVALTEASRIAFADSVVKFLVTYGFDGVDFDWEYPVNGGMKTNVRRPIDEKNYTLLLQKVREKLNAQQALDGKKYSLSIAAGASNNFTETTQLDQISKIVDHVQLMTYDVHGAWDSLTGFNAPLYASSAETTPGPSVSQAVQIFLDKGVPANKLVMGVPFYGNEYKGVNNANNGLYQARTGGVYSDSYGELEKKFIGKDGYVRYWDSESKVPYLWNGSTFISYDDAESMSQKASYIKSNGLAGAMIWEVSQDPSETLLNQLGLDLK